MLCVKCISNSNPHRFFKTMISAIIFSIGISDIISLLIIFIVIYVIQYYYHYFTRPNPLPGPFPIPIFGSIRQSIGLDFNEWLVLMHKKYGDMYEINLAGQHSIVLCRADLIENMIVSSTKTKYP